MNRIGQFEKVSFKQFYEAMSDLFKDEENKDQLIQSAYEKVKIPKRATSGSAGYDFVSPFSFVLRPGESIKIPTGIRVNIENGWWLGCLPRSGLGFKYRLQLNNTMGVIDSDYYHSDNEGHIFAKITNDSNEGKVFEVDPGDSFMQAIFLPFGITYDDAADGVRNGGFGSTSVPHVVELARSAAVA